ncbi:hypothetical protein IQ238_22365 [Pleurocapsales cyanobacterium LEGE 06147]|nr:hypothetical protein [Pleurocapsales cyanobacterium LEGE 06147]
MSKDKNNSEQRQTSKPIVDPAKIVSEPEDLEHQRNLAENQEEIITNPAVAPQMLDDKRDLRVDLTRDRKEEK